jgi:regulator of sigma E protease
MEQIFTYLTSFISSLGPFFLLLGLLIFVHEFGHFIVAVMCGVRVETFSLGFGKKILKYKRGHTTYCVSIIPLGGYVKMFGDDPTNPPPPEDQGQSFLHQPVLPRIAIVLAGPLMNLLFAALLFAHIAYWGEPVPGTKIGDVATSSAAYQGGLRSGDTILKINNNELKTWREVVETIETRAGLNTLFEVASESGETKKLNLTPELKSNPNIFSLEREVGVVDGLGIDSRSPVVSVPDESKSFGIKHLDLVLKINGEKIEYYRDLDARLSALLVAGKAFTLHLENTLEASGKAERTITIEPKNIARGTSAMARLGLESSELSIFSVKKDSPAAIAGLAPGDRLLSIGSKTLTAWGDILENVKTYDPARGPLSVKVARAGSKIDFQIIPEVTEIPNQKGNFDKRFAIGISPALYTTSNPMVIFKADGFLASLRLGAVKSWEWTKLIGISFVRLIQAEVSAKNIGGVISIGKVANQSYDMGWVAFIKMMAILSINLFLLNLLPVPVLDGGHLVFFTIEAIKGSPLSLKKMEIAQQVGLVLLLALMGLSFFNDITNLLFHW